MHAPTRRVGSAVTGKLQIISGGKLCGFRGSFSLRGDGG